MDAFIAEKRSRAKDLRALREALEREESSASDGASTAPLSSSAPAAADGAAAAPAPPVDAFGLPAKALGILPPSAGAVPFASSSSSPPTSSGASLSVLRGGADTYVGDLDWSPHELNLLCSAQRGSGGGSGCVKLWDADRVGGDGGRGLALVELGGPRADGGGGGSGAAAPTVAVDVTVARFSASHAGIVVGGTASGRLHVWDYRAQREPVQSSRHSETGHTSAISSILFCGERGLVSDSTLVSSSCDGRVCHYSMANLAEPMSGSNIVHTAGRRSVPALVTCAAAIGSPMATSTLVGTADGFLDTVLLGTGMASVAASSPLSNHPIDIVAQTRAHYAGISAISIRPSRLKAFQSKLAHRVRSSALALSCSFDGTVKIWDVETSAPQLLETIERMDPTCIADAAWSPVDPCVFAALDATLCTVRIYDIERLSREEPIATESCSSDAPRSSSDGGHRGGGGGTKIAWSRDGLRLAIGDARGDTHIRTLASLAPHEGEGAS